MFREIAKEEKEHKAQKKFILLVGLLPGVPIVEREHSTSIGALGLFYWCHRISDCVHRESPRYDVTTLPLSLSWKMACF